MTVTVVDVRARDVRAGMVVRRGAAWWEVRETRPTPGGGYVYVELVDLHGGQAFTAYVVPPGEKLSCAASVPAAGTVEEVAS